MNADQIMDLAAAELLRIHECLETLAVPRLFNDEKLSASQRVLVLIGAYKSACTRVVTG